MAPRTATRRSRLAAACFLALALAVLASCKRESAATCRPTFSFAPPLPRIARREGDNEYFVKRLDRCAASVATPTAAVEKVLQAIGVTSTVRPPGVGVSSVDYYLLTKQGNHWRRDPITSNTCEIDDYRACGLEQVFAKQEFDVAVDGERIALVKRPAADGEPFSWVAYVRSGRAPTIRQVAVARTTAELLAREPKRPPQESE